MCCCCVNKRLGELNESLLLVAHELSGIRFVLSRPGRMRVRVTKEVDGMPHFVVTLPAPEASANVVSRELAATVAGSEPVVVSPSVDAAESDEFEGQYGDSIRLELVDTDQAGNRSTPSVFDGVLIDTMPPPQAMLIPSGVF